MIIYAREEIQRHFEVDLHPESRTVVLDLDAFCVQEGIVLLQPPDEDGETPNLCITDIERSLKELEDIYWRHEMAEAKNRGRVITEQAARELARMRFSWHLHFAAVDLRDRYAPVHRAKILYWLTERCPRHARDPKTKKLVKGPWEFIHKPHGTGPHFHIARRDYAWQKSHPAR